MPAWGLRAKLALWSTLVLLLALLLYSALVYLSLRQVLWHELDERLHNDIETVEGLLQPFWTASGLRLPPGARALDADDYRWLQVWSPDGQLLFASDVATATPIPALAGPPGDRALSLDFGREGPLRVKEESGHIAGYPVIVRAVASEARLHQEIAEVRRFVGLAVPLVVAIAALGGYHLVRRTLTPVDNLVVGARQITADRLDVRLPAGDPRDEVGQIAQAFNETLSRLEASFEQMRRFTANASHELRTPLAALRTTGQAVLSAEGDLDAYREAVADMLDDAEQLSRVVDTMMLLAQADAGTLPVELQRADLNALVTGVARECDVLAQEKDQRIVLACTAGTASVDPTVLRIAVANVLHNAIRYGSPSSTITVRAFTEGASSVIEVQDSGPGIAAEHHAHLFERFYRVDPARTRALGGAGLGLAMARWSVEAHGGHIQLESREGEGSTFRIVLPRHPAAVHPV
jgi:heavy metal sensor kinase